MAEDAAKNKSLEIDYTPPREELDGSSRRDSERDLLLSGRLPRMRSISIFRTRREWQPTEQDWKLPENWKEIILKGMEERLGQYRSYQLFLDICVRCGACADKCHFFIGSGDPKNMPVLRAELLRSVYRKVLHHLWKDAWEPLPERENLRKRW